MKNFKRVLCFMFALLMAFSVVTISSPEKKVEAAAQKYSFESRFWTYNNAYIGQKIGSYYVYTGTEYISGKGNVIEIKVGTKASTAKPIVKYLYNKYDIDSSMVTDGTTLYYRVINKSTKVNTFHKVPLKGGTPKKICTLAASNNITKFVGVYGSYIIYNNRPSGSSSQNLCTYNVTTNVKKRVATGFIADSSYGPNVVNSDWYDLKVYNVSTNKVKLLKRDTRSYFFWTYPYREHCVTSSRVYVWYANNAANYDGVLAYIPVGGGSLVTLYKQRAQSTPYNCEYVGPTYALFTKKVNGKDVYYKFTYSTKAFTKA